MEKKTKTKWIIALSVGFLLLTTSFGLGWTLSHKHTNNAYITNVKTVRSIAELGITEIKGSAKVDLGNEKYANNSVLDFLRTTSLAANIKLTVPFVARYGIVFNNTQPLIKNEGDKIEVTLPPVKLISYELHLDQMDAVSRKGLSLFEYKDDYIEAERILYQRNRKMYEIDHPYISMAEQRITGLLNDYFSPGGKSVTVSFKAN